MNLSAMHLLVWMFQKMCMCLGSEVIGHNFRRAQQLFELLVILDAGTFGKSADT